MDACGCVDFASIFDRRTAERDRDRYRRNGPDRSTRILLEMIGPYGLSGSTVLDVGGGIGVIDHELLKAGAARAVLVDASAAYLDIARQEGTRAGLAARMGFVSGDLVTRADEIEAADIVTLDRVICCYPDVEALVAATAPRARTVYGLVLPRDRWLIRAGTRLVNFWFRIRRSPYRSYAHANRRIDAWLAAIGLRPKQEGGTFLWRVVVYDRDGPLGDASPTLLMAE